MPIDPQIALRGQFEPPDLGSAYRFKALMDQARGQKQVQERQLEHYDLQNQGLRRGMAEEDAVREAIRGSPNPQSAVRNVMAVSPKAGAALQEALSKASKAELDQEKSRIEINFEKLRGAAQLLSVARDQPTYDAALQRIRGMGIDISEHPKEFNKQYVSDQITSARTTAESLTEAHNAVMEALRDKEVKSHVATADAERPGKVAASAMQERVAEFQADPANRGMTPEQFAADQRNDFESFYTGWLAEKGLPRNAANQFSARKAFDQAEVDKTIAGRDTSTADQRNYQLAQKEGFKGTFNDFLTVDANRRAPRITINNNPGQQLTPNEAETLGVPYGTTRGEAAKMGITPSSQAQKTAATYAGRLTNSNEIINSVEGLITKPGLPSQYIQRSDWTPNFLKSAEFQKFDQAQRDFVNAVLRRESGAVISESEFTNARRQYLPQPGDKPEVLKQKRRNREIERDEFIRSASGAYVPPATQAPGGVVKWGRDAQGNPVPVP
jgi:hypothetical protein